MIDYINLLHVCADVHPDEPVDENEDLVDLTKIFMKTFKVSTYP